MQRRVAIGVMAKVSSGQHSHIPWVVLGILFQQVHVYQRKGQCSPAISKRDKSKGLTQLHSKG